MQLGIAFLAAGPVSAGFTSIVNPTTPGEDTHKTILDRRIHPEGGPWTATGINFSNNLYLANRIPDTPEGTGIAAPLVIDSPTRDLNTTDQSWLYTFQSPTVEGVFAAFTNGLNFGYFTGERSLDGVTYNSIDVPVPQFVNGYPANPVVFNLSVPRKPIRWGRGGGPDFPSGPNYPPEYGGERIVSSRNPDNEDAKDHMVSYELVSRFPEDTPRQREFLLFFEDLLELEPWDRDYNDLVVRVKATELPSERWKPPAGNVGNWDDEANWIGDIPNDIDAVANFFEDIPADTTVALNSAISVRTVQLRSASHAYKFIGPQELTIFALGSVKGRVNVEEGNHIFDVPVNVNAPATGAAEMSLNVFRASDLLTFNQTFTISNVGPLNLTKRGPGRVDMKRIVGSGDPDHSPVALRVDSGTLRFLPPSSTTGVQASRVNSIEVASDAKIEFGDRSALIVDYSASASPGSVLAAIRNLIVQGYHGGGPNAWKGNGITRFNVNPGANGYAKNFAVGYAEANSFTARSSPIAIPTIFGTIDSSSILIRGTRYGDANLDGNVGLGDFNLLASSFGRPNKSWIDGDFNYDGIVNLGDFNLLASNFGLAATGGGPTPADWAALAAAVPEPGCSVLIGCAAALQPRRRSGEPRTNHGSRPNGKLVCVAGNESDAFRAGGSMADAPAASA
jgi:hypothetical protein